MYAYLRGKVASKTASHIIIDVQGVGYKVAMPARMVQDLTLGQEATIYTYLQVREDALALYGFSEQETLTLFEMLLTVTGIGPKLALAIVDGTRASALYQAIVDNELTQLTRIPGVGKKTAQRLVWELKDKVAASLPQLSSLETTDAASGDQSVRSQVIAALTALGYRPDEAQGALRAARNQAPALPEQVDALLREPLKYLGSRAK
jgi:Holliday junction DNA helicase RuvA